MATIPKWVIDDVAPLQEPFKVYGWRVLLQWRNAPPSAVVTEFLLVQPTQAAALDYARTLRDALNSVQDALLAAADGESVACALSLLEAARRVSVVADRLGYGNVPQPLLSPLMGLHSAGVVMCNALSRQHQPSVKASAGLAEERLITPDTPGEDEDHDGTTETG